MILKPNITKLPVFTDSRGSLSFAEEKSQIPFNVHRTRWIYGASADSLKEERAESEMLIIALCGSADLKVNTADSSSFFRLDASDMSLYVPKNAVVEMNSVSDDAFILLFEGDESKDGNVVNTQSVFELQKDYLSRCGIIELPLEEKTDNGGIVGVKNGSDLPFNVRRVYYMYDVPGHLSRGGHAHKYLHQIIIPAAGRFKVTLWNGRERVDYTLDDARRGLYVHSGIWNELSDFSPGAVCMVLASDLFDAEDYLSSEQEYRDFLLS